MNAVASFISDTNASTDDYALFNWIENGGQLVIGEGSVVRQCRVRPGRKVVVGRNCVVMNCSFESDVSIGADCVLVNSKFCAGEASELLPGTSVQDGAVLGSVLQGAFLRTTVVRSKARGALCYDSNMAQVDADDNLTMKSSKLSADRYRMGSADDKDDGMRMVIGKDALLISGSLCRSGTWRTRDRMWSVVVGDRLTMQNAAMTMYTLSARLGNDVHIMSQPGLHRDEYHYDTTTGSIPLTMDSLSLGDNCVLQMPDNFSGYTHHSSVICGSLTVGAGTSVLADGVLRYADKVDIRSNGRYLKL